MRRPPLDPPRRPRMGRLALLPLGAAVLFGALGALSQFVTDQRRQSAVSEALIARGHPAPIAVEAIAGAECGRASEGYTWRTGRASGWACAGPGDSVRFMSGPAPGAGADGGTDAPPP